MANDKIFLDYREESRKNWGVFTADEDEGLGREQLKTGALLRIADSLETIEADKQELQEEIEHLQGRLDRMGKMYAKKREALEDARNSLRTQKGWVTRLQKSEAAADEEIQRLRAERDEAVEFLERLANSIARSNTGYVGDHTVYKHRVAEKGLNELKGLIVDLKA